MKRFFTALRGVLAALFITAVVFFGRRIVTAVEETGHFRPASSRLTSLFENENTPTSPEASSSAKDAAPSGSPGQGAANGGSGPEDALSDGAGLGRTDGGSGSEDSAGLGRTDGGSGSEGALSGSAGLGRTDGGSGPEDALSGGAGQGQADGARVAGFLEFMTASPEAETEGLTGFNYDCLDETTRQLYRQLYTGISREKETMFITACATSDAGRALNALLSDHPEFFWMDGEASVYGLKGASVVQITFKFNLPAEEIPSASAAINAAAKEYEATLPEGAGDYDKVKAAYEYIIRTTDYDWNLTGTHSQNIQSVFIDRLSVCAGYAMAFKYLLDRQGIPCAFLSGTATSPNGGTESHAWNLVTIDGVNTYVDVTWGDPAYIGGGDAGPDFISYDYLCLTSEEMARTGHSLSDNQTALLCTDRTYDYYIRNGLYREDFDADAAAFALMNAVDNDRTEVRFKFGSEEAFRKARTALFEDGLVSEALQNRMIWDNLSSITYYNQCSEGLYTIRIFW